MKKRIVSLAVVLVLMLGLVLNFVNMSSNKFISEADTNAGVEYLNSLSALSVEEVQKSVDKVQQKYLTIRQQAQIKEAVEKSIKLIDKGEKSYRSVFKNVCFAGDSLMAGLETYEILNSKKIIAQVSASLYHLEENMDTIVKKSPQVLILHYGINMIATEDEYLNNFISLYTKLIKKLQKKLPETRIIVSLIFPVDRSLATAERFKRVSAYNKALKKMCKGLDVEYLDSSSVLKAHKECYGSDGIHQSKAFYEKYWLKFIMREKGIY